LKNNVGGRQGYGGLPPAEETAPRLGGRQGYGVFLRPFKTRVGLFASRPGKRKEKKWPFVHGEILAEDLKQEAR